MRLDTAKEETITNLSGSRKFSMNASAKAFQILSSGIYERKIEAIVRELSCNAYDSHVEAGKKDTAFRIQLPTPINDFVFSVEDFGVGLSEDEVYNVYTTYFESTKTDSNEVIGALGLGSKTPFSYTDSFTIKSRKNGKEWVFTAFIGTSGEPEVQKMYERPWAGENGVEVSVEVASKDVREFYNCAEKVLSWFEVKPTCNRELNYHIDESIVNSVREYGYHLEQKTGFGRSVDCKVLMGNVAYDLDLSDLKTEDHNTATNEFIEQLYNMKANVYFEVNIGDADVAASRETLSLDDKTKQNLRNRLEHIRVNFEKTTIAKMGNFKNVVEAYNTLTPYERSVVKNHKVNGWSIRQYDQRRGQVRTTVSEAFVEEPEAEAVRVQDISDDYDIAIFSDGGSFRARSRSKRESSGNINDMVDTDNKVRVVINDCERKMGIKDAIMDNPALGRKVLVISDKNGSLSKDLEDYLNYITFNSFKVIYASTFWDGKLSANKSVSSGLAEETVKGQIMLRSRRTFMNDKIDLSDEDKGNWAYVEGGGAYHRTIRFSDESTNFVSDGELGAVMRELDLDGIIAYNGNNAKKVKRILGPNQELVKLIEAKASESVYRKYLEFQELVSMHIDHYLIFEGYEIMHDTMKGGIDYTCVQCSKVRYERAFKFRRDITDELSSTINSRIEVFSYQIQLLRESSNLLKEVLTGHRFDTNMVPEVRQFIKMKKGV